MRVVITGGTGLIGRALTRNLVQDGHEVVVLSRNPAIQHGVIPPNVQIVAWDGRTPTGWGHLVDGASAIVNLAGESLAGENFAALITKRWTPEQKRRIRESRLNAGSAVSQAIQAARQKPGLLVQASAVGYYGSRGDEILAENAPPGSDFAARVCIDWENSTADVEPIGVRRAVIRTGGVVLSLDGGAFPFMLLPFKFFVGGPLGGGKQWFSWIHIADEVSAIRFLMDNPKAQGAYNLTAPQALTNAEFSLILSQVIKRPAFFPTPAFMLRLLFGEKSEVLLGSQHQVPVRLQELGFRWQFPTADAALRDLF